MLEQLIQVSLSNPIVPTVVVGVVRSIAGYLENKVKTGEAFSFEALAATLARVFPQVLALSAAGLPPEVAFGTDWGIGKIVKIGKK